MNFLDYSLIVIATIGFYGIGRAIARSRDAWLDFLAGLVLAGGIAGCLAWVAPLAVRPLFQGMIALGWAVLTWGTIKQRQSWGSSGAWVRRAWPSITAMAVSLVVLINYHHRFYVIAEDYIYYAVFNELLAADYIGALRVPLSYPDEFSALHIAPIAVWAALGALLPKATMSHGLEIRYLLVAGALAHLIVRAWYRPEVSRPVALGLVILLYYLFFGEFEYATRTSSYFFFMILLALSAWMIMGAAGDVGEGETARIVIYFACGLVMVKTSVFYIPAILALYIALRHPLRALHSWNLVIGALTILQILTVLSRPRPFADVSIYLSLVRPDLWVPALDYFSRSPDAVVTRYAWIWPENKFATGVLAAFAIFVVKCWFAPVAALGRARVGEILSEGRRYLELFLLVSLLSWLFIRHGDQDNVHQMNALAGSAAVTMAAIIAVAIKARTVGWRVALILATLVYLLAEHNPWKRIVGMESRHYGGMTYEELNAASREEALNHRPGEPLWHVGMRALYLGERINKGRDFLEQMGVIAAYVVPQEKEYIPTNFERFFVVPYSPAVVWAAIADPARAAALLPGIEVELIGDGTRLKIKLLARLGPIEAAIGGEADVARDESARRGIIHGRGTHEKSGTTVDGEIKYTVQEAGPGATRLDITAALNLSGPYARYAQSVYIDRIVNKAVELFARNLERRLDSPPPDAASRKGSPP
jgi:carbon monoxide dehydrogenase subunit G